MGAENPDEDEDLMTSSPPLLPLVSPASSLCSEFLTFAVAATDNMDRCPGFSASCPRLRAWKVKELILDGFTEAIEGPRTSEFLSEKKMKG